MYASNRSVNIVLLVISAVSCHIKCRWLINQQDNNSHGEGVLGPMKSQLPATSNGAQGQK